MIIKSIRGKLLAYLAFLLLCILAGFGMTVYEMQRRNEMNQIDRDLEHRVSAVSSDVRNRRSARNYSTNDVARRTSTNWFGPPRPAILAEQSNQSQTNARPRRIWLSSSTVRLFNEGDTNDFYFIIWSRDGELLRHSHNAPARLSVPDRPGTDTIVHLRTRERNREAYNFSDLGECALVGHLCVTDLAELRNFGLWLIAVGAAVLLVGLGGVWWFVNRAIRPVETISNTARQIAAGKLSERIKVRNYESELGQLAAVLNSTFSRLEAAFIQQKHFTADASHELRTPISVLISETQTTLSRDRSADEYKETIEACLETAQQMRKLTESLLELARFDSGQETVPTEKFDLAKTTREAIEFVTPLAEARGIEILFNLAPAYIRGDEGRISQVVVNLLTNAIRYNKDNGKIGVTIHHDYEVVELSVSDTGRGINQSELPRVFERFFRVDKARNGATGGVGLGLAICKAIVEAHGGTILVSSKPELGSLFMVQFPAIPGMIHEPKTEIIARA